MALVEVLPILNLSLQDIRDMNSIAIADFSKYIALPTSGYYNLQITPPGYDTIAVTFTPGQVNIYQCADLGITCSDTGCTPLPDGIYQVIYTVVPTPAQTSLFSTESVTLKFIKIDSIKCKYQHAFLKIDMECGCHNPKFYNYEKELKMIKLYIDASVAECNSGNYKLSYEYYAKANRMLDKLGCKYPNSKWKLCNC